MSPTKGKFFIDGNDLYEGRKTNLIHQWRSSISYVSQSIVLSDSSIYENIAFGIDPRLIDKQKVIDSAKKAHIHSFIKTLEKGYDSNVGEGGEKLSGGQVQRIGLARAFYRLSFNINLLILDESTSALDNETESKVMKSIFNLDKNITIIIVTHRLSTLNFCDRIIEIKKGNISEISIN